MTPMTDPARGDVGRVAKGLTKAQRDWLLAPGYVDPNTLRALRRKGIKATGYRGLTPFGEAVRQHLGTGEGGRP